MAKRGTARTNVEYAVARALIGGLGLLPRPLAVAAGRGMGHIAYVFCGGLRRTGERNLKLAFPETSRRERKRILRGCFNSLGRQLGEFSQFPRATAEGLRHIVEYDSRGMEYFLEAKARGRGILFITPHLGAWELLVFASSAFGDPLSFLVRPIDNPRIEQMIENVRMRFGNQPIDKKAAALTALRVLRQGGTLGFLADLNTQPHEGVFVPFFGRLACTTTGVAVLALRTDAVVIPVCAPWDEARKRYVFRGGPILELVRTGDHARDIEINTARFTSAIESQIRAYPDQWLWIHKRWRTRPEGEPDLYKFSAELPDHNN
ncbi:MAG: lysophospholipid acyltransferase family protein [Acidobacteria bacterium]|nr:lysophospholipid acyltransferase family protein [Acidobacteriota bacterium]